MLAELHINSAVLPLDIDGDEHRTKIKNALWDLATYLNTWACELDKGGHMRSARATFFASAAGLGPDLVVKTE